MHSKTNPHLVLPIPCQACSCLGASAHIYVNGTGRKEIQELGSIKQMFKLDPKPSPARGKPSCTTHGLWLSTSSGMILFIYWTYLPTKKCTAFSKHLHYLMIGSSFMKMCIFGVINLSCDGTVVLVTTEIIQQHSKLVCKQ